MAKSLSLIYSKLNNICDPGEGYGDKGTTHSYIEIYGEILKPYQSLNCNILEIGLLNGTSLLMWEEYFENAKVYGIDCSETPLNGRYDLRPMIQSGKHNIIIGDAENLEEMQKHFNDIKFSIIIEDANHSVQQQLKIYENFKDKLSPGGLYIIEDIADIDSTRKQFEQLDNTCKIEILDRRKIKGRFDDVLVIIHKF